MKKLYMVIVVMSLMAFLGGCSFLMQDDWEGGKNQNRVVAFDASTEAIPGFNLKPNGTYAILQPKSPSIKEQKIHHILLELFSNNTDKTLIEDIESADYVLAYSQSMQKSTYVYSVPEFYSTYTNYSGFNGSSVSATSYGTGSSQRMATDYYNVINLSLFEWKEDRLNIAWSGNTVVDSSEFKSQYKTYVEVLYKLIGKETKGNSVNVRITPDGSWKITQY